MASQELAGWETFGAPGEAFGLYAEGEKEDRVWNSDAGGPLFGHGGEGKIGNEL